MSKNGLGFRQGFRSNPVQALTKDISLVTNITAKIITALLFLTLGKKRCEITGNEITKLRNYLFNGRGSVYLQRKV